MKYSSKHPFLWNRYLQGTTLLSEEEATEGSEARRGVYKRPYRFNSYIESARTYQGRDELQVGRTAWQSQLEATLRAIGVAADAVSAATVQATTVVVPGVPGEPPSAPPPPTSPVPSPPALPTTVTASFSYNLMRNLPSVISINWATTWGTPAGYLDVVTETTSFGTVRTNYYYEYFVQRFLLFCNLDPLPAAAQMVSGYLSFNVINWSIYPPTYADVPPVVCLQRAYAATWDSPYDYFAYTGTPDGPVTVAVGANQIALSATSLTYIKANAGRYCFFMLREYTHDYLNSAPARQENIFATGYSNAASVVSLRPTLVLTYNI